MFNAEVEKWGKMVKARTCRDVCDPIALAF